MAIWDGLRSYRAPPAVYAPTGAKLALMSGQTLQKAFVSLPGKGAAVYTSGGLDHYRHSDWLGSVRLTSSTTRAVLSTAAYAPFGETYAQSGTADASFTGQNADTVGGNYDFMYREYSVQGRWPSPDPAGLAAANPANPQSWNRYAYVMNNPLGGVDPLGLSCVSVTDENGNQSFADDGDGQGCAAASVAPGSPGDPNNVTPDQVNVQAQNPSDLEYWWAISTNEIPNYVPNDVPLNSYQTAVFGLAYQRSAHDLGCVGMGWALSGGSMAASAPVFGKGFSMGSGTSGTSAASKVLRGVPNPFGSVPTPVGTPGTSTFAWRATGDAGAIVSRYLPYAGTAVGAVTTYRCLGQKP